MKTGPLKNQKGWLWIVLILGVISLSGYLFFSYQIAGQLGFPLDDGWIHQTYARNFARYGEWAYSPGKISGGSTSPFWTVLLSLGHLVGLGPFWGTFFLGGLSFFVLALFGDLIFKTQTLATIKFPIVAFLLIFEWHLCWAAVSGMETILHAAIILLILFLCLENKPPMIIGLLVGLSVWIRPDGMTLLGPLFFTLVLNNEENKTRIVQLLKGFVGFLLFFVPYLIFNKLVAGTWMPNTFYAKQTEYEIILSTPIWQRIAQLGLQPLVGVGVFLLPGFIYEIIQAVQKRDWGMCGAGLWFLGYILIYVFRLPVVYQHGRYLIPAMPVFFVIGGIGVYRLIKIGLSKKALLRVLTQVWALSAIIILMAFWWKGGESYGQDVGFINENMVEPSIWLEANLPGGTALAAHDIGALGYFASVEIVDLAGLVTPEIIPIMRDEKALWEYLEKSEINYLMTFPDWYTTLPKGAVPVYESGDKFAELLDSSKMTIYQLEQD